MAPTRSVFIGLAFGASVLAWAPIGSAEAPGVVPANVRPKVVKKGRRTASRAKPGRELLLESSDKSTLLRVGSTALKRTARLTIQQVTGYRDPALRSLTYEFGPAGQRFAEPVEVCLTVERTHRKENLCLGYFDPSAGKWTCEDTCPTRYRTDDPRKLLLCGKTDHFTAFSALFVPGTTKASCQAAEEDLPVPIQWGRAGSK
jgi:hypothetical protein